MNDPTRPPDPDELFARALEQEHQRIAALERKAELSIEESDAADFEPRIRSAVEVLELLEQVKPSNSASGTVEETTRLDHVGETPRPEGGELADIAGKQSATKFERLGRFRIREQIGRGGYGIVVRAHDPDLNRDVAIKIPRLETSLSPDARLRFDREGQAAAALNHPGIVTVHETGTIDGVHYIVSEFVDGENLATLLARGQKITPRKAAELVSDIADAIEHAHQRGVLHRDIKPANIIIDRMDETPRVTDFGLATIADQQDLTQTGGIVGTPAYMSPEQAAGDKDQIGPATDVYGLGALLYRLLTGQSPFEGLPMLEMLRAIGERDPTAPGVFNRKIPRDLEAICLKCLAKNAGQRYASALDLQTDLQRFLDNKQVVARRVTQVDRMMRWAKRNPALATTSIGLFVALTIGLVTAIVLWRTSESNRLTAEVNQSKFQSRSTELETLLDRMFERIRRMPELAENGMESVRETMLSDVDKYYNVLLSEAPDNALLQQKQGAAMLRLAAIKSSLADHSGAVEVAERLIDSIPDDPTPNQVQQKVDALMLMARGLWQLEETDRQRSCFDDALALARQTFVSISAPTDDAQIEFANTLSEAAEIVGLWGDRTLANQLAEESVRIWDSLPVEDLTDSATILALGKSYAAAASSWRQSEQRIIAREYSQRSMDVIELRLDAATRQTPDVQFLLSDVYLSQGVSFRIEIEKAMPLLDRSLQIASQLALDHPLIPGYRQQIGKIEYQRGLTQYVAWLVDKLAPDGQEHLDLSLQIYADAITFLENCCQQFPDNKSLFTPALTSCHTTTGLIYSETKRYEEGLGKLEVALALALEIDGDVHSADSKARVMGIYTNIGTTCLKMGNYSEAIANMEIANADLEQALTGDPDNGTLARFLSSNCEFLAECYSATNQHEQALDAYRNSMAAYREGLPESMMGLEAVYLVNTGQIGEAMIQLQRFVDHQWGMSQPEAEQLPGLPATDRQIASALPKMILHCGSLVTAVETLPDEERTLAADLKSQSIAAAMEALTTIHESSNNNDETALDNLLNDEKLAALRRTPEFAQWESTR